jgi:hypothetical protein
MADKFKVMAKGLQKFMSVKAFKRKMKESANACKLKR